VSQLPPRGRRLLHARWWPGSLAPSSFAGEAVAEAPRLGAGLDDVCAVGVMRSTTALASLGVGEDLDPFAEKQVGGDDQRAALVALGDDLEDELGGSFGQGQLAEFVEHDELSARVAADHACEFAARLSLLEFIGDGW
jgi:hypothetical protein